MQHCTSFFPKLKSNLLGKKTFPLSNAPFAMAIVNLIIMYIAASFVIMLSRHSKYSEFCGFLIDCDLYWEYISYNSYYLSFLPYSFPLHRVLVTLFNL